MLTLFRKNHIIRSFALLLYTIVVHSFSFFHTEVGSPIQNGVLSDSMLAFMNPNSVLADILVILLVFFQAILINRTVIINRISNENTLFAGLFYILFSAMIPSFQWLSPTLIANTFIIIAFNQFFSIYGKKLVTVHLINIGLLIGVAGLLNSAYYAFFLWAILGIIMFKSINLKLFLQLLIGVFLPLLWAAFFYYMFGTIESFFHKLPSDFGFLSFHPSGSKTIIITSILLTFIVLISVLFHSSIVKKKLIKSRKGIDLLYWNMIIAALSVLFIQGASELHFLLLIFPLSILISIVFSTTKRESFAELVHFALLIACIMANVYSFFNFN